MHFAFGGRWRVVLHEGKRPIVAHAEVRLLVSPLRLRRVQARHPERLWWRAPKSNTTPLARRNDIRPCRSSRPREGRRSCAVDRPWVLARRKRARSIDDRGRCDERAVRAAFEVADEERAIHCVSDDAVARVRAEHTARVRVLS